MQHVIKYAITIVVLLAIIWFGYRAWDTVMDQLNDDLTEARAQAEVAQVVAHAARDSLSAYMVESEARILRADSARLAAEKRLQAATRVRTVLRPRLDTLILSQPDSAALRKGLEALAESYEETILVLEYQARQDSIIKHELREQVSRFAVALERTQEEADANWRAYQASEAARKRDRIAGGGIILILAAVAIIR